MALVETESTLLKEAISTLMTLDNALKDPLALKKELRDTMINLSRVQIMVEEEECQK